MTEKASNQKFSKFLLAFAAIGLTPIALGYGLLPDKTLTPLYGFSVDNVNLVHIMRAVMALYFGQIVFWFMGVANSKYRKPALYALIVFMLGLVPGRVASILIDGTPHWLLLLYLFLELSIGLLGIYALKKEFSK